MAIVHLSGTKLAPQRIKAPLNRRFMYAMGFTFLIAMHFYFPNAGKSALELTFNNFIWISASIALGIGLYQTARNRTIRYTKLTIALFLSCLLLSFPILYPNAHITSAATKLSGLWAGWLLFFLLQQFSLSNRHRQRLLWFVLLAVAIETAIGYFQLIFIDKIRFLDFLQQNSTPFGVFQDRHAMASFLASGVVLSGYMLARQQQKYGQRLSRTTLLYLLPLICVPLLVILESKIGWLGAALGAILVIPYLFRFSTKRRLYGWSSSAALGVVIGVIVSSSPINPVQISDNEPVVVSYTLPQALDMFIEKPFTGYGYGRFEPEYMLYTARQHQLNNRYPSGIPSIEHPQNEILFWGVEGGVVPLLGILLAIIFVMAKLLSIRKGTRLSIFALFLPIVLHTQFEAIFYYSAIHWLTFVLLLFWLDQRSANYKAYNFSSYTRVNLRISSMLLPLAVTYFMVTTLHTGYLLVTFENSNPKDPTLLNKTSNTFIWKDRFNWDINSSNLKLGLVANDPKLIQPYIEWSSEVIQRKPRDLFYSNLILAYLGMNEESKAEQIRSEAQFLFPNRSFDDVELDVVSNEEQP